MTPVAEAFALLAGSALVNTVAWLALLPEASKPVLGSLRLWRWRPGRSRANPGGRSLPEHGRPGLFARLPSDPWRCRHCGDPLARVSRELLCGPCEEAPR